MPSAIEVDRPRVWRSLPGCIAIGFALTVVIAAALFALFAIGPNEARIEERWERAAGFSPLIAYPPRDPNIVALRVERLGASLGLEIGRESRTHREAVARARWKVLAPDLKAYFAALRVPTPRLAPPTPGLSTFLAEAEPTLREVRETLRASAPPRWELHLERGMDYEVPDLLGHLHLQRLLLVAAADAARSGRYDESSDWLDAADRLQAALAEDPLLIHQLIAMAELGSELAVLRALERPPAGWRERLAGIDRRESMERALRLEGWFLVYAVRTGQLEKKVHTVPGGYLLLRLLARHGASQIVESIEDAIAELRKRDLRGFDADAFNRQCQRRVRPWNVMARWNFPLSLDVPARAARNRLDVELTARVMTARERIAAGSADALASLPDNRRSSVRHFVWLYERSPDELVIRANGDLPTSATSALPLTVRLPL